jgi:hypothetical protein
MIMQRSTSDILWTTPNREIVVWRRLGGGNPGYGLDVDGETKAFLTRAYVPLRTEAEKLAKARGLDLARPAEQRVTIPEHKARPSTVDTERLLGRFYAASAEYAWAEQMFPEGT